MSLETPLEYITGVWKFVRQPRGYSCCRSTPGHLLHLLLEGSYRLRSNNRDYSVQQGDIIYYHESEFVEWLGNTETVTFYSVSFSAPYIEPLPLTSRVFKASTAIKNSFEKMYQASLHQDNQFQRFTMFSALYDILSLLSLQEEKPRQNEFNTWHQIEQLIRQKQLFRPSLNELADLTGKSRATVVRTCRKVTGKSPMKWLQSYRMAEAKGLLQFSNLNVTQVADYLGYPRMHEFSREFTNYFGYSPKNEKTRSTPS